MKKILRAICLTFVLVLLAGLCGCSGAKSAMPTLKIVYLAGNVTSTYDVAGRENAITTRGIFGDNTKTYSWDEPLEPTVINASESGGSIQLAFSYAANDLSVYVSDPETGETQTVTGTTIEVDAGKSYSISAAGSCCHGHGGDKGGLAGCMAWINHNRKMRQLVEYRNCRKIQGVAGIGFKGADTPFAENDILIALAHNVFCAHQQLLEGIRKTPLQ